MQETSAPPAGAEGQVTALYRAHAVGRVRLAMLTLPNAVAGGEAVWIAVNNPGTIAF